MNVFNFLVPFLLFLGCVNKVGDDKILKNKPDNKTIVDSNIKTSAGVQSFYSTNNNTSDSIINLKNFGAKGLGVASLKEDTAALHKAIAYLNARGGGKLYVPDPPKFYAFAGNGIFVGNNIEIYGDGKGKSEIRNVNPLSGKFLRGPILLFSTYGPNNDQGIFQSGVEQYSIADAKMNDTKVVLKDAGNAAKLFAGEVVVLGAGVFNKFNEAKSKSTSRFHQMELNEITSINKNEITFKYPFSVNLKTQAGAAPVIMNINNTQSLNRQLGIKNGSSKNIFIHDMSFSQAQTDEINNKPFDAEVFGNGETGLSGIWQPGGAFASVFKNLKISCYTSLGGNMFTRCEFSNIDVEAKKNLFDFGYGASNNVVHDIKWTLMEGAASSFSTSLIIINDGTHNITMYNINASGNWTGENLILLNQANHINFHDMVLNFPQYSANNTAISIGDKEGSISRDITLSDISINVASIRQFLSVGTDKASTNEDRNIKLTNLTFTGNISENNNENNFAAQGGNPLKKMNQKSKGMVRNNKAGFGFVVQNVNGLTVNNVSVSSGDILFMNCNNSTVEKIKGPRSTMVTKNSNARFANNTVRDHQSNVNKLTQ
jgi:hypothetical protein